MVYGLAVVEGPALTYQDDLGARQAFELGEEARSVVIGRDETSDIALAWDDEVSRVHAVLERIGADWTVVDDGLSQNGTFVNGERVQGRRRLRDGDRLRIGEVAIVYSFPDDAGARSTAKAAAGAVAQISDAQRRVLIALCRPYREGGAFATPPTNAQIAEELIVGVDTVKAHMRALYDRFGVGDDVPQQQKRSRLVELAFRTGEVNLRDLDTAP